MSITLPTHTSAVSIVTTGGVGPVIIGDHLEGFIGEKKMIDLKVK